MSQPRPATHKIRPADLSQSQPTGFEILPDVDARAALATELELIGLRKLRFSGQIRAVGKADWRIDATLGATVVQPCVVTLEPVTTRIDERVTRLFLADYVVPEGAEVEMDEDDTIEPLPALIDLDAVMAEALALHLPAYPRTEGVDPVSLDYTEPGKTALGDEDVKPFAGLAALRDKLSGKE
jgi:uncharacterized metal-binding protein YceD (DUF177 family)